MTSLPAVIYVGGYGRSGSTVLEHHLSQHVGAFSAGELASLFGWAHSGGLCACGRLVLDCQVWGRLLTERYDQQDLLRLHLSSVSVERSRRPMQHPLYGLWRTTWEQVLEYLRSLGIETLIDSSKTAGGTKRPVLLGDLVRRAGQPLAFVHLSRDPRAVLRSVEKGTNTDLESGQSASDPRLLRTFRAGAGWTRAEILARAYAQDNPRYAIGVRYEDFVTNVEQELARIGRLLSSMQITANSVDVGQHGIGGNRVRRAGELNVVPDYLVTTDARLSSRAIGLPLAIARNWLHRHQNTSFVSDGVDP